MSRVYNFSAGPAVLPEEVLREAAEEMMDYKGCGMSVMEMSHRSKVFDEIIKEAEADLQYFNFIGLMRDCNPANVQPASSGDGGGHPSRKGGADQRTPFPHSG